MRIILTVEAGPNQGRVFEYEEHANFLVGRSSRATFRLPKDDMFFSRIHFMIEVNPPLCRLTDMGSTNGTLVNGRKVHSADLKDGDKIGAGHTQLRLAITDSEMHEPTMIETLMLPEGFWGHHKTPSQGIRVLAETVACRVCEARLPETIPMLSLNKLVNRTGRSTVSGLCLNCLNEVQSRPQSVAGYQIVRELGRGEMGVVYLAIREADGGLVALKTIQPVVTVSDREIHRFLREANILGQLDHPNIVAFREMGEAGGVLHFAMDYVPGTDALTLLKQQGGPLPIARAVGLVSQMLKALEYTHAKGFVHRDIKPSNLLITSEGGREIAKLADFGLARVYQTSRMSGLTMTGDLGGTISYIAPEQITDLRETKPAADQYSAAATLYTFLTGRHVFDFTNRLEEQIQKVLLDDPVPIRLRRPDIPEELAKAIHRALARDPASRFNDVSEMNRALGEF